MRTMLRGKFTLLFMMFGLLLAIPAVALADTITADPDPATVVVVENNVNKAPGETGTAKVWLTVDDNSTDPVNGCNANTTAPVSITLSSNNPDVTFDSSGTKANPASLTGCTSTNAKEIGYTVSSSATGPFPKTVQVTASGSGGRTTTSGGSGGTTNTPAYTSDTFTVTITAPADSTAPTTSATATKATSPVSSYTFGDWSNKDVTVTLNATDNTGGAGVDKTRYTLDGTDPTTTNGTVYSAPFTVSTEGTTTLKFRSWDKATTPNAEAVQIQTIKIDKTNPTFNCPADDGTWHGSNPTFNCTASGGDSGLTPTSDANFSLSTTVADGSENNNASTDTKTLTDGAGNTTTAVVNGIKVDRKAPSFNCEGADTAWHATNQTFNCSASDGGSGLDPTGDSSFSLSTTVAAGNETNSASTGTKTLTDGVGNTVTAPAITGVKVDMKAPLLTDEGPTTTPNGDGGWYKSAVTNGFKATDGGSGFAPSGNLTKSFTETSGTNEGAAVKIASGAVSDAVGNSAASINSAEFKIDLSDPYDVAFQGGPDADGSYFFGDTPDKPSCTAKDDVSGFASCEVTGYSTAVGSHTMTATAKDNAGRTATATRSYTVKAWTTQGFYQPVDMNGVYNTVKGGSTVPFKFELFKGTTELTDVGTAIGTPGTTGSSSDVKQTKIACDGTHPEDAIEATATGGTSLRYDTTGGQFIYNWKTPTGAGSCYKVTIPAKDGSSLTAYFKMK